MKIAIVTGAARGLGLEIARLLTLRGFTVWSPGRDIMDIGDPASVARAMDYPSKNLGTIDVLINNAAVLSECLGQSMRVNALGAYHVTRACWPLFLKPGARIVNISSIEGVMHGAGFGGRAYSVSKAALNAITRMQSVNPDGVVVNACCPGWFRSRLGGDKAPRSAEQAADTPVWLATEAPPELNGNFVRDRTIISW